MVCWLAGSCTLLLFYSQKPCSEQNCGCKPLANDAVSGTAQADVELPLLLNCWVKSLPEVSMVTVNAVGHTLLGDIDSQLTAKINASIGE